MPGLDGIATLRRMREATAKVPILILTSQHDVAAAVEATTLGADDFITRPIENEELVVRAALTIKHRRMAEELETLRSKTQCQRAAPLRFGDPFHGKQQTSSGRPVV